MILIWTEIFKFVGVEHFGEVPESKPNLSFEYDWIHYDINQRVAVKTISDNDVNLTDEECSFVENFIKSYDFLVYPILEDQSTGEAIKKSECNGVYAHCPKPACADIDHMIYSQQTKQWEFIHCVNQEGVYIGNIAYTDCYQVVPSFWPSVNHRWNFETKEWEFPLEEFKQLQIEHFKNFYEDKRNIGITHDGYCFPISAFNLDKIKQDTVTLTLIDEDEDEITFTDSTEIENLKSKINLINNEIDNHESKIISFLTLATTVEEIQNARFDDFFFSQ